MTRRAKMSNKANDYQKVLAEDSRGKNVIISAQAGAGKTTSLTNRIIKLAQYNPDNEAETDSITDMLVVTFTNKAARELKDRIKSKFLQKMNESKDGLEIKHYKDQYDKVEEAQISTMHSFGIQVLRDYFYEVDMPSFKNYGQKYNKDLNFSNVDHAFEKLYGHESDKDLAINLNPSFKIVTDSSLSVLMWKSINEVFENLYEEASPEFTNFLDEYTSRYSDNEIKKTIFSTYSFIRSQADPFKWIEDKIEELDQYSKKLEKEGGQYATEVLFNYYRPTVDKILNYYDQAQKVFGDELAFEAANSNVKLIAGLKKNDIKKDIVPSITKNLIYDLGYIFEGLRAANDYEQLNKVILENFPSTSEEETKVFPSILFPTAKQIDTAIDHIGRMDESQATSLIQAFEIDNYIIEKIESYKDIQKTDQDYIKYYWNSFINPAKDLLYINNKGNAKNFFTYTPEILIEDSKRVLENLRTLVKIVKMYHINLMANKEEVDSLDFNDIEHLVTEVLDKDTVREPLKNKFKHIFFDEYQDANKVQNDIVNKLSKGNNLFFVGDLKQSIYSFRLADPKLFIERYESYKQGDDNLQLDFFKNFRTSKRLLEFNNLIFDNLFTKDLGGIDYTETKNVSYEDPDEKSQDKLKNEDLGVHRLAPGKDHYPGGSKIYVDYIIKDLDRVKISNSDSTFYGNDDNHDSFLDLDADLQGQESYGNTKLSDRVQVKKEIRDRISDQDYEKLSWSSEALLAADKVKDLVGSGKYKYGDIAILSRDHNIFKDFINVFDDQDIPFFYDSTGFDYKDTEIATFIQILKAVDNDRDDITLISALASSLGGFNENDLAKVRLAKDENGEFTFKSSSKSFNYAFRNYCDQADIDQVICEKIKAYENKIETYRKLEKTMSLYDFCWYVFEDSGYQTYVLGRADGKRKLDNMKQFFKEIYELESQNFHTLSSFITYLDILHEREMTERETNAELSDEDNVVRFLSMHKSKGLEFKVTILVNLNKKFSTNNSKGQAIFDDKLGVGLKLYDKTENNLRKSFMFQENQDANMEQRNSEELRLLYVAMTRAEHETHLISSVNFPSDDSIDQYLQANRLDKSAIDKDRYLSDKDMNHKLASIAKDVEEDDPKDMNTFHKWIYHVLNKTEDTGIYQMDYHYQSDLVKEAYLGEQNIDDLIENMINFKYDRSLEGKPFKRTVTQLNQKRPDSLIDYENYEMQDLEIAPDYTRQNYLDMLRPAYLATDAGQDESVRKLDSMELGTLYHYLFENLPISDDINIEKHINEYLPDYLKSEDFISEIYKNIESLVDNKDFDIYKRMVEANKNEKLTKELSFTMRKMYDEEAFFLVDGQIDLAFEEDGEYVILDYKTNKEINTEAYVDQLNLYADAVESFTGKTVKELLLYWVRHGKLTEVERRIL